MAINTIQGFNPSTTEPIDSRVTVANETARLAFATFNVYEGLIVYQEDTDELYVLNDAANPDQTSSWSTVGGGSGFPFTGSASISGSLDVVGNTYLQDAYLEQHLYHTGDTNTYLRFDNDQIRLIAANYTVFDTTGYSGTIKIGAINNPQDIYLQNDAGVGLFLQKNTGNVGIGTTSPTSLLHIKDNVNGRVHIESGPSSGTSNSTARLIIEDNTSNAIQFLTPTGSFNSSIYFGDADNNSQGLINYNQSADQLTLEGNSSFLIRSGGQNRLIVNSSGNVGIGTSSPSEKLHVVGDATITGSLNMSGSINLTGDQREINILGDDGQVALKLNDTNAGATDTGKIGWYINGTLYGSITANGGSPTDGLILRSETSRAITFKTNGNFDRMIIQQDGNVGIGTTSPSAKLHVFSDTHSDFLDNGILLDVSSSDEGEPAVAFRNQSDMGSNYWITGINNGGQNLDFAYGTAFTSANTNVRFTSDGKVGIGTTSPSQKLHVDGNIRVGDVNDVIFTNKLYGVSTGDLTLYTSGNTLLTQTGNVGIGTTSPSYKLDVSGSANISGDLIINDTISTPNNTSLRLEPSGSTGQIFFGSPSDGTILYHYSRANNGDNAYYNFDGGYYVITTNDTYGIKLNNDVLVSGDLTVDGIVTAQEFHTEFVSASIIYQSGSTKFGDTSDDIHSFTGSLEVSGSTSISNKLFIGTGSFITDKDLSIKVSDDVNGGIEVIRTNNAQKLRIGYGSITGVSQGLSLRGDGVNFNLNSSKSSGDAFTFTKTSGRRLTDTDAEQAWISAVPDIGQSGTANYVGILLDVTETSTGSGTNYLTDLRVGGSSKFNVTNDGKVGIGTTNPTGSLQLLTPSTTTLRVDSTNSFGNGIKLETTGLNQNLTSDGGTFSIIGKYSTVWEMNTNLIIPQQYFYGGGVNFRKRGTTDNLIEINLEDSASPRMLLKGSGTTSSTTSLLVENSNGDVGIQVLDNGNVGIGGNAQTSATYKLRVHGGLWADTLLQLQTLQGTAGVGSIRYYDGGATLNMDVYGPHASEAVKGILQLRSQDLSYTTLANSILHSDPDFLDNPSFVIRSRNTDDESYAMMNYKSGSGFMLKTSEPAGTGTADIIFKPSGSEVLFLSSSGNVGIGTTSPSAKLEIKGTGTASTDTHFRVVEAGGTGNLFRVNQRQTIARFLTGSDGILLPTNQPVYYGGSTVYTKRDSTLNAFVYSQGGTEHFAIKDGGNVGIGTTSPSASLSIGDGTTSGVNVYLNKKDNNAAGYYVVNEGNAAGRTAFIRQTSGEDAEVGTSNTNNLSFLTNDTVRVHIDGDNNNGNVGIGTTSPIRLLHLSASDIGISPNVLIEQAGTGNSSLGFKLAGSTEFNMGIDNADGNKFKIHRNYPVGGSGNVLTIDGSNNVGIGTTSPAATLDIRGTISQTVDAQTNQYPLSFYNSHSGTDYYLLRQRVVNTGNQVRTGLGITGVPDAAFVLGSQTDQILKFATSGRIRNVQEILGSSTLEIIGTDIRLGDGNNSQGSGIVNIVGASGKVPVLVQQESGSSQTKFIRFLDSGSTEVMGITTDGGFVASTDTLIKRFSYSHAYDGSNVSDGQGVGISLITDDSSNNLRDIAYIDAVQDDISEDESSLRFSVGETTPTEVMRLQSDGKVGIGTTSPGSPLTVAGRVDFQNDLRLRGTDSAANQGVTRFYVNSDNKFHIDTANDGSNLFIIDSAGNVGIGTTSPTEKLDVNGTVKATAFVETSAKKFKENIEPISSALETVVQLQGVTFNRIGEEKVEYGFIADEVKDIIPELVSHDANGEVHGVHYARTVAVLTEAIKELDNKVKAQDLFIKDLVARIEKLENK